MQQFVYGNWAKLRQSFAKLSSRVYGNKWMEKTLQASDSLNKEGHARTVFEASGCVTKIFSSSHEIFKLLRVKGHHCSGGNYKQ